MAGKPAGATRAPRGALTVDRIIEATIRIIDGEGVEAVTMARLAADLHVKPMSLYTHFRDKNAILRAANDVFLERLVLPVREIPDIAHLRAVMVAYFRLLIETPIVLQFDAAWEGTSETEARVNEELYACLAHLGLDTRSAIGVLATLIRHTVGSAYVYRGRRKWDEDAGYWDRFRANIGALPAEAYPAMHRVWEEFEVFTQPAAFEFGLDMLLGAIASYASGESAPPGLSAGDTTSTGG